MSSIPEQDIPQYMELKGKTIQKNTDAYNKKKAEYDQASAEYQKEMDAYNAELKKQQDKEKEREAVTAEYAEKLRKLEAAKAAIIVPQYQMVYDRSTRQYVEKPIDKAQRDAIYNEQAAKINTEIKKIQDKASSAISQYDFSQKYPGVAIGGTVRDQFKASFGRASLIDLYEKHKTQKEIEAEYNRRTSEQQARNAPRYTDLQKSAIESEHVGLLFTPTPQTEAAISRAEKIKPILPPKDTIFPFVPTMAENTRRPLINVETGNYIQGEWKPNNPVALVSALSKPEIKEGVQIAKTPESQPVQESGYLFKGNVINEESGRALLKFQSRLEPNQEVPSSLYFGILEERGLPVTPFSKDIISTFASDRVKPTIREAKGKKDTVTDPITGKSFNRETMSGDIGLGGILGYTFKTVEQPTIQLGGDVQGPPQPLWTIPDAFGNPRTDSSGNPILLKSQEKAEKLSERFAKKPSKMTIPVLGGQRELIVQPPETPKETSFNKLLEKSYRSVDEFQTNLNKKYPGDTTVSIISMFSEGAKIALKTGGFIVSSTEQYVDPYIEKALALKPTKRPAPILLPGTTSDETLFPFDFDKMQFKSPSRILTEAQQYREQQGGGALVTGFVSYYPGAGAIKPILGTVKETPRIFGKFLKTETKIAEKEGIAISTGGKELGMFPSKSWDLAEPVQKVGFRKDAKIPTVTTEKIGFRPESVTAKPNPFGKERIIPYYFRQTVTGITTPIISTGQTIKESLFAAGSKIKRSVINVDKSPNLSIIEGRNVPIPNVSRPQPVFSNLDVLKQNLEISYQKNVKPFLGKMGEVWQGRSEIPSTPKSYTSLDRFQQRVKIGVFKTRQSFDQIGKIKGIEFPKPKTPEFIKSAQRGWQGYKFMQQKRFESWKGGLPSFPILKTPKVTGKIKLSEQMELFKTKQNIKDTLAKMGQITDVEKPVPKVIVPSYGRNFLNRLKTLSGEKEPWDFLSKVKPFQKLNIRAEFPFNQLRSPITKIKGISSRQEFAKLLQDTVKLPQTKLGTFPYRSKLSDLFRRTGDSSYDIERQQMLKDIGKLRSKGSDIFQRQQRMFQARKLSYKSSDTGFEIIRYDLKEMMKQPRRITSLKSDAFDLANKGKLMITGVVIKKGKIVSRYFDLKPLKTKSFVGLDTFKFRSDISDILKKGYRFVQTQKAERYSAIFTKAGLGTKQPTVKNLIGEGLVKQRGISNIKKDVFEQIAKNKLTAQTEGFGFKVDLPEDTRLTRKSKELFESFTKEKKTEVQKLLEESKTKKKVSIDWKLNPYDTFKVKAVKEMLKNNEAWKAVGLATGGTGALVATSAYQPQEASALPFSPRIVESGSQKLIQIIRPNKIPTDIPESFGTPKFSTGTTKPVSIKSQMLVPPFKTLSEQREETKTKATTGIKLIPLESVGFKAVQKSSIKTVQTPKIKTAQMPKFNLRLSTPQKTKTEQTPKLRETQRYRTDTYQALRTSTKVTPKLAQKQSFKLVTPTPLKIPTRTSQPSKLVQPPVTTFRYKRPPPKLPPRTRKFVPILPPDEKKKGKKKSKRGYKADYLGNVSETKLEGIFKRQETTYGQSKINKLLTGDIRIVKGKKRETKRGPIKWKEGKKGDVFGFKYESKKKKGVSFW